MEGRCRAVSVSYRRSKGEHQHISPTYHCWLWADQWWRGWVFFLVFNNPLCHQNVHQHINQLSTVQSCRLILTVITAVPLQSILPCSTSRLISPLPCAFIHHKKLCTPESLVWVSSGCVSRISKGIDFKVGQAVCLFLTFGKWERVQFTRTFQALAKDHVASDYDQVQLQCIHFSHVSQLSAKSVSCSSPHVCGLLATAVLIFPSRATNPTGVIVAYVIVMPQVKHVAKLKNESDTIFCSLCQLSWHLRTYVLSRLCWGAWGGESALCSCNHERRA